MNEKNIQKKEKEFVLQPTAISRAMYDMSPTARKLIAAAMAMAEDYEGRGYQAVFDLLDYYQILGIPRGGKQDLVVEAAVVECAQSIIKIKSPNEWRLYPWLQEAHLEKHQDSWHFLCIIFNPKVANVIREFKKAYSKIQLADLGKLQSRYSIRFYELALSYSGFAGKDGNKKDCWYFEISIGELREFFQIEKNKYKITSDFKKRVIDNPITEINAANIGIRIEPAYLRRGKWLQGVRLNCRWVRPGDPLPVSPATESEIDAEKLKKKYPKEFEKFFAEEKKQQDLFPTTPELHDLAAAGRAVQRLVAIKGRPAKKRLLDAEKPL